MKRLLLHVCCGPCAIYVVKKLQGEYQVSLYFYNPNIQPEEEYQRRKNEVEKWSDKEKFDLIISPYKNQEWLEKVAGHEKDPEGGERCQICYRIRILDTAKYAGTNGYDFFATTLTISPHKKAEVINRIGREVEDQLDNRVKFIKADWKKQNGFKKACELSKEQGFYRQNYCGCLYSFKNMNIDK